MSAFNAYEHLAYVIPGAAFLLGLAVLFPWVREQLAIIGNVNFITGIGAFVIVAYVAGNLLQVVGRGGLYFEWFYGPESSYHTNAVLEKDQRILSDDDRKNLFERSEYDRKKLLEKLKTVSPPDKQTPVLDKNKQTSIPDKKSQLVIWRGDVWRMYAKVLKCADGKSGKNKASSEPSQGAQGVAPADLLLNFQRNQALHLDLAAAFLVLSICAAFLWIVQQYQPAWLGTLGVPETPMGLRLFQIALSLILMGLALNRAWHFDFYFARTLFLTYLYGECPT